MHPYYLQDFIGKQRKEVEEQLNFLKQGVASIYSHVNKRDLVDLQWTITGVNTAWEAYDTKLRQLSDLLEKLTKKQEAEKSAQS